MTHPIVIGILLGAIAAAVIGFVQWPDKGEQKDQVVCQSQK